jgi:subtilisin-like proprotein convertase family protein
VVSDGELQSAADTVNVVVEPPAQGWDVTHSAADTPKSIPDSDTTGISSTITVAAAGTVAKAEVKVDIAHPYVSALRVRLECPDGTMVTLRDYTGGGGKNIDETFPVTACNGKPAAGTWRLWADDKDGYSDSGQLVGWTLSLKLGGGAATWDVQETSADTPTSIPDSDTTGISSTITAVGASGLVSKAQVEVEIQHPYIGALRVRLECPDGTMVTLHDYTGGSGKNIDATYPVAACNGKPAAGSWRLRADDKDGYSDNGQLVSWTLFVKTE